MEREEFQFGTREEYEQALEEMLGPEQVGCNTPSRAAMSKKDLEHYDALVDEYLRFCSESDDAE